MGFRSWVRKLLRINQQPERNFDKKGLLDYQVLIAKNDQGFAI